MIAFNHFNFNVLDLEKSLAFYSEALGLKPIRENHKEAFSLVFLGDGVTGFSLELTYMKDRKEPYNLGEKEYHLAFVTDEFDALHKKHAEMGCICYENTAMGIYFIEDPDGYWIEIVPKRN
ncbi:MAG: lactoylglutathione lyase [Clostridiales bacterium]|nr:lactoylglutathione lyase [Clostridiales bacterium]